jgi:heat-inducible transcriptional repressor
MIEQKLSEREKNILSYVIQHFILTANPVGSRFISKHFDLNLSPATIRNVLADLESYGYIDHPHTSAGRVPTDKGYRFYVDTLVDYKKIPEQLQEEIKKNLDVRTAHTEEILKEASSLLAVISKEIAIISSPQISNGILNKVDLIDISSNRIMVIMSLKSGLVKTIIFEIDFQMKRDQLEEIAQYLNERLHGLTLVQIRETFVERMKDIQNEKTGLIRIFIESADHLFDEFPAQGRLHLSGTPGIFNQPEFSLPENMKGIIELVEDKDVIVHVLENRESSDEIVITIGEENRNEKLINYSLVTSKYSIGDVSGVVGVMGPKRMDYSQIVSLVNYFSQNISNLLGIK